VVPSGVRETDTISGEQRVRQRQQSPATRATDDAVYIARVAHIETDQLYTERTSHQEQLCEEKVVRRIRRVH
jgi:hypothetical protein